jgi:superfamily II DNA or RNA helicase
VRVHIRFDRGTLLFGDVAPGFDLGAIRGVRYDERVHAWRARACDKPSIVHALKARDIEIADDAWRPLPALERVPDVQLRDYQEGALAAWERAHRRGVVVLPTGSGKTRIAIAAIARTGQRALVLVPTRVLLEQWVAQLASAGFTSVGRYGDGHHELGAVTVATLDAAWRWMHKLGDAFDLLVVDEVHRVGGEVRGEALEMSIAAARLGLTATMPDAEATARIERIVGPVVHVSTIEDLAGTFLAPFEIVVMGIELLRAERATYDRHMSSFRSWVDEQLYVEPELSIEDLAKRSRRSPEGRAAFDALRRAQASLYFPAHKRVILGQLLEKHRARKVLVFTPDNKTAFAIAREHLVPPITCDMPRAERAHVLDLFRQGAIRCVVSSQVLNEGVDVPDADVAIVVGGRKGEREHVQRIGRVLRPSAGKSATVFELVVTRSSEVRAGFKRRGPLLRSTYT